MPQTKKFILQQTLVLTKLGVSAQDIEASIRWVDAHLPDKADAATWVPTSADLADDGVISEAAVLDARSAWYLDRNVPRAMKRILDSRLEA